MRAAFTSPRRLSPAVRATEESKKTGESPPRPYIESRTAFASPRLFGSAVCIQKLPKDFIVLPYCAILSFMIQSPKLTLIFEFRSVRCSTRSPRDCRPLRCTGSEAMINFAPPPPPPRKFFLDWGL